MNKTLISLLLAFALLMTNASMAFALSPVAEVYYHAGASTYHSDDFEAELNDAVKAKLTAAGIDSKYVSIMDASANPASVHDTSHVHSGRGSWYDFGSQPEIETEDYNHVQISNGGKTLAFYGYTSPAYKDFMLTDDAPTGKKVITFEMDESKVDYHSMEGGGFLFNTEIDGDGKLSGYAILFVSGNVKVLQLSNMDANQLHNETARQLSAMPGVTTLGTYPKGVSTVHSIKINVTDSKLNMWDNGTQTIVDLALPIAYGDQFGPLVSHVSHGCGIISVFTFDNMKLFSTSNKTLDVAVNDVVWEPYAPLRYFVNINDHVGEYLDGGSNQASLAASLNQDASSYVSVTSATYEAESLSLIGSLAEGGLFVDSGQSGTAIVEAIADRIAAQILGTYKEAILDIEAAESQTNISYSSGDFKNSVTNDLTLVQSDGVTTTWSSDQPDVIDSEGNVTRPVIAQPGTYVTMKATMTKDGLTSEKTFTVYVLVAEPEPLEALTAVAGNGQATLSFPALTGAANGSISVEISTDGTNFSPATTTETLTAASTSATVTGLDNGTTYHVRLNVGSGHYAGISNAVQVRPSEPVSTLTAVGGYRAISLRFPALTGAAEGDITVEVSTDGTTFAPATTAETLTSASTSATVTGLVDGTTYYVRLVVDSGSRAGVSNVLQTATSTPVGTLTATAGNGEATMSFPALTGAANGDITVEVSTDGTTFATATTAETLTSASTSATVTGLDNGTTYYVRLNVGSGQYAGISNAIQVLPSNPVRSLTATAGNRQITLGFPALTGAADGDIAVEISTDGITYAPATTEALTAASTRATVTGLENGTTYYVRLSVRSGVHAGTSNVVTVRPSAPSAPAAPTLETKPIVTDPANGSTVVQEKITKFVGDGLKVSGTIKGADGKPLNLPAIVMSQDGTFALPHVGPGEYALALTVSGPNGEKLAGPSGQLTVDAKGNAELKVDLIDPYGTILDTITGEPLAGVDMKLYWADTELNRSKGKVPGTLVSLPELPDFPPNQNHNPQTSSDNGEYGWMVYADGDYYFTGEKDGYVLFDSRKDTRDEQFGTDSYIRGGIIHVGETIVKFSFDLQAESAAAGEHDAYMAGYPDGTFRPERGITRAEVASILSRLYESKSTGLPPAYADVHSTHWANPMIANATNNGWMIGIGNNKFDPNRQVTRAEFAQILSNVYDWDAAGESGYADMSGHWAEEAVAAAEREGLLADFAGGQFEPGQALTRLEAVRIFNLLLERRPWVVDVQPVWSDVAKEHPDYSDIMEASVAHPFERYTNGYELWNAPSDK